MPNGVPQLCHVKFRPYAEPNVLMCVMNLTMKVFLWHTLDLVMKCAKTTLKQQMAGANGLKKWRATPNGVPQLCHVKFRPYEEPNFLIKVFLWHTLDLVMKRAKTMLKQQMAGANGLKKWRAMPNGVPQLCHVKFRPYAEPNVLMHVMNLTMKVFLWHARRRGLTHGHPQSELR